MKGVTVVDHPLVQHKLTLMRNKGTLDQIFRELLKEWALSPRRRDPRLPLDRGRDRDAARMPMIRRHRGKKLVFVPILRTGMGLLEGMLDLVPAARMAHIGLYRDPRRLAGGILLQVALRSWRPPCDRRVSVLATGNTASPR